MNILIITKTHEPTLIQTHNFYYSLHARAYVSILQSHVIDDKTL